MADTESQSPRKRRKIRKGTTSCWECKRRKVQCSLVDTPNAVCTACQRRGTKCVTQDVLDETSDGNTKTVEDVVSSGPERIRTRVIRGTVTSPPARGTRDAPAAPATDEQPQGASKQLYASLPSRKDMEIISEVAAHVPISFFTFITRPYPEIERGQDEASALLERPSADSHPVLLARYILRIVMILQCLDLKKMGKRLSRLSDAPQLMMKRLAETAIRLVNTHDELLGTVEGIECVMMEGSYQANCGNFRSAWIAMRKAMTLAQVMGIHRPGPCPMRFLDPRRRVDPAFLWYRILHIDRFMCLMMGLPQGSMDRSIATERALALDTAMGRLERVYCVIASRILELNDVHTDSYPMDKVQEIDRNLQNAADLMPAGWWIVPNLAKDPNTSEENTTDWDTIRLVNQIYHYGLIIQLHIRYMLRFTNTEAEKLHNYSQTACVNASREILTRYITLHNSNLVAYTCRVVDFFTITGTLLLLIAHLRQHARTPDMLNHLAHQRPSDRAIASQVIENLQHIGWVSQDRIIANSATLLNRLLDVEAEAAKGRLYTTHSIDTPEEVAQETENGPPPVAKGLRFCIPNFGFVRIVPDGQIQKEGSGSGMGQSGAGARSLPTPDSGEIRPEWNTPSTTRGQDLLYSNQQGPEQEHPWYAYPGSGTDDWTLQGLDMTFFDCLLQGPLMACDGNIQGL